MNKPKLPIGYYLKKADNLLTDGINRLQAEFGFTRTDWQILNSIYETKGIEKQSILTILEQFDSVNNLESAIDRLRTRSLINGENHLSVTDSGMELYSRCLRKQKEFRRMAMRGITEQEYLQLLETLDKIINNIS